MQAWDAAEVMRLFRERLLARLVERHAISEALVLKLFAWRHPGFSAHVGEAIPFELKKAIEDVACYLVRNPLSLKKLVYLDGQQAVLYRSRMNPTLGRNFEAMDPLEWLARIADHIPDPGKHRTHFYGYYANRARGNGSVKTAAPDPEAKATEAEKPKKRCSPSWGTAPLKGPPGRSTSVPHVRRPAQDRGLHHGWPLHPPDPGPPRAQSAGGEAASRDRRGGACAGGRRRTGDRNHGLRAVPPQADRSCRLPSDRRTARGVVSASRSTSRLGRHESLRLAGPGTTPELSHGWW